VFAKYPRFEFKLKTAIFFTGVFFMPIFEYICKECEHEFEALVFGKQKAECPKCRSKKLQPQLSVFAVSAKSGANQPSMPVASGPCGSCGDVRGPGACSLNDLD
jgi:putative FmdB family regulatory protein